MHHLNTISLNVCVFFCNLLSPSLSLSLYIFFNFVSYIFLHRALLCMSRRTHRRISLFRVAISRVGSKSTVDTHSSLCWTPPPLTLSFHRALFFHSSLSKQLCFFDAIHFLSSSSTTAVARALLQREMNLLAYCFLSLPPHIPRVELS